MAHRNIVEGGPWDPHPPSPGLSAPLENVMGVFKSFNPEYRGVFEKNHSKKVGSSKTSMQVSRYKNINMLNILIYTI